MISKEAQALDKLEFKPTDLDHNQYEYSTTIKTPKYSHIKNSNIKPIDPFAMFDESHNKSKTAAGLDHISPSHSNRLFNFSATGVTSAYRQTPFVFGNSSSMSKKQKVDGGSGDTRKDQQQEQLYNQRQHIIVNPFNGRPESILGNTPRSRSHRREEEDFEIKPRDIYGLRENQPATNTSHNEDSKPFTKEVRDHPYFAMEESQCEAMAQQQAMYQLHYQHYLEN